MKQGRQHAAGGARARATAQTMLLADQQADERGAEHVAAHQLVDPYRIRRPARADR